MLQIKYHIHLIACLKKKNACVSIRTPEVNTLRVVRKGGREWVSYSKITKINIKNRTIFQFILVACVFLLGMGH